MARFPKGSINNTTNKAVEKTSEKGKILAVYSNTSAIPGAPTEPAINSLTTRKWLNFGSDNLWPQAIAQLNRKSPSHRGILNWKTIYFSGKGFKTEDKELAKWIKSCNNKRQSLKTVIKRAFYDKSSGGNGYIEIVTNKDKSFLSLFHKDWTTCRISKDKKGVEIYGNWEHVSSANEGDIKTIPLYPAFAEDAETKGVLRSIYHIKDYEPEFSDYGVPGWIAAMDAAAIAYKTNKWNVSRLDNDFSGSGTLVVEGNITPKEAKQMVKDFKATHTGEGKQGKVLFVVKALGGGKTEFVQTNKVADGDWLQLHKQADQDLIIAHNWFPALSGVAQPGQMGDNQQMRTQYQVALTTVIGEEQETFINILHEIISANSKLKVEDLAFHNEMPLSLQDLLDPKVVLTKNEQRAIFGYEEVAETITQALNGAQVDSLINILTSAALGSIPRESAIAVIVGAFGQTKEVAESMLSTIGNGFKPPIEKN